MFKSYKRLFVSRVFKSQHGMTLLEVLLALGIAASLIGFATSYIGNTPFNLMRQEGNRLFRMIRYAYFQAAAKSQYYRLVMDLENQTYHIEYSEKPFFIIRADDEVEARRLKNLQNNSDEEIEDYDDLEEFAEQEAASQFAESEDEALEIFEMPEDIKISGVFVSHQKELVEEGKAYLYFFPRGQTEFAVIHLSDLEDEEHFSLIVNPLTGFTEIREGFVEYEEILAEWQQE